MGKETGTHRLRWTAAVVGAFMVVATVVALVTHSDSSDDDAPPAVTTVEVRKATGPGRNMYSELDGLTFAVALRGRSVQAGEVLGAELVISNRTSREIGWNECTDGLTQSGLVPVDRPNAGLPPRFIIDCARSSIATVPAHASIHRSIEVGFMEKGFVARNSIRDFGGRFGGTLAPGRYRAVVEVPGRSTKVRVTAPEVVTVRPHPCGGFSDDLVKAFPLSPKP